MQRNISRIWHHDWFCFVAHVWLPMEFPLWKQPFFHGKNNVDGPDGLFFRNLPGHQTNPPKSQQTPRGWIPEKEKWTIFGRYRGIQAFYLGVHQASGRHHKSLVAVGKTWVPHGLRRALNDQQWTNSVPKCAFTCQHVGKLGLKTSPFQNSAHKHLIDLIASAQLRLQYSPFPFPC